MKLKYKILWIDDQMDDILSIGTKDDIQDYLKELEFEPTIDCYETRAIAEEKLTQYQYDLILSDYVIGAGENRGNYLIEWIRSNGIFTEVLFYSAEKDFEKALVKTDRISYFSLVGDEGYREFKQKVYWLIDQTVRKFEELTPMRGLVMAETSSLDSKVENILADYFLPDDKETDKLKEKILKKIEDSLLSNFTKNEKFQTELLALKLRDKSAYEIVKGRVYDASKKAWTIEKLIKLNKLEEKDGFSSFFENYKKDVLDLRNNLAHARSEIIDDIEWLIVDGGDPEKYGAEECKEIRKCLRKYSTNLDELHQIVSLNSQKIIDEKLQDNPPRKEN